MSEKMTPEREALLRLADALAGDVDRASDSNLLAEAAGDQIDVEKLARVTRIVVPRLEWVERLIRPRWPTPLQTTKRLTGGVMLLLGLSLIVPVPFGHVVPALVIMLLALAYLEEDGVALLVALVAALISLAATAMTLWGAVETIDWIDPRTLR